MTFPRPPHRLGSKIAHCHILVADMTLPGQMRNSRRRGSGREQADGDIVRDIVHFILPDALALERGVSGLLTVRSACLVPRLFPGIAELTLLQRLDRDRSYALFDD